jgi:hypothetical protein
VSEYRLRPYRPEDHPHIYEILKATLALGEPLPFPVMDLDDQLQLFVEYYLQHEPLLARVAEDERGRLVGYQLCTLHAAEAEAWRTRQAIRFGWQMFWRWPAYDAFTRLYYRLRLRDALETLRDRTPFLPAHMHWHFLPEVRGRLFQDCLSFFQEHCRRAGVAAGGGEIIVDERHRRTHWQRIGITPVGEAPHHTLSVILGKPVWRVMLRATPQEARPYF